MHTAIAWFVRNPVAANLMMFFLVVCGLVGSVLVNQEEFPNIDVRAVSISVPYLGAAPEEVEKAVCVRIEEAIDGLEGIDKIQSSATEGVCSVFAELFMDTDDTVALNEIKSRVDGIISFPVLAILDTVLPRDYSMRKMSNATLANIGGAGLYLLSDMGAGTTGEIIFVDGGYHAIGMAQPGNL